MLLMAARFYSTKLAICRCCCKQSYCECYRRERFGRWAPTRFGTLGIIVPPSVILIMFGVLTNTSIGGLFMAGVIPGLMLAAVFMMTAYIVGVREGFPKAEGKMDWGLFLRDTGGALPALLMPFMVLGSIVTGFATATEAA
ncbi:TRAP transporter large permease subunit, partial [Pseudomonas syringae]|uniref:TRAP transporter large permease subunit n=1 Tax=Pseudomonas syringae TaxID=317 RepID=UPI001FFA1509